MMMGSKYCQLSADYSIVAWLQCVYGILSTPSALKTSSGRRERGYMSKINCEETMPRVRGADKPGVRTFRGSVTVGRWTLASRLARSRSFDVNRLISLHHVLPSLPSSPAAHGCITKFIIDGITYSSNVPNAQSSHSPICPVRHVTAATTLSIRNLNAQRATMIVLANPGSTRKFPVRRT